MWMLVQVLGKYTGYSNLVLTILHRSANVVDVYCQGYASHQTLPPKRKH